MTKFISYLVDFSLPTFFASNFVIECLITFEKKKKQNAPFFEKFSMKHEKDFSALVCSHGSKMSSSGNQGSFETIDPDRLKIDRDSIILARHIQGVQK